MVAHLLPPQLHVFVRDWLSANNVLLKGRDGAVLIDTGYVRHAPLTLALLATTRGLSGQPLAKIVNTHCHSDHMGGNGALVRAYGCPVAVPEGEAASIAAWDDRSLLLEYCDQNADRFAVGEVLRAGSTHVWGDLEWDAIAAPGHDMGALCFYNADYRVLVSGDALWEQGFGFVMPPQIDPQALPATRATLEALSVLDVRVVIPGHGEPFTGYDAAIERAFRRLEAFEEDPMRLARHALKVVLTFALLDRRSLPLADLPSYVERVGIYREFNARFFRLPPAELAEFLVNELKRAGAIRIEDGRLVPAAAAAG
jgi:glyoxylase-like metal-dependent hydrolase (beta-lactamase superfamily II)